MIPWWLIPGWSGLKTPLLVAVQGQDMEPLEVTGDGGAVLRSPLGAWAEPSFNLRKGSWVILRESGRILGRIVRRFTGGSSEEPSAEVELYHGDWAGEIGSGWSQWVEDTVGCWPLHVRTGAQRQHFRLAEIRRVWAGEAKLPTSKKNPTKRALWVERLQTMRTQG
jgi:hypothetical protein